MSRQIPRDLPHKVDRKRDENDALGHIRGTAFRSGAIAAGIYATLMTERLLMVAITDTGEVFAVNPSGLRGEAISARQPSWIIGTYTRRCGVGAIQRDMREYQRLLKVAA
jgi:hypothetical protein